MEMEVLGSRLCMICILAYSGGCVIVSLIVEVNGVF